MLPRAFSFSLSFSLPLSAESRAAEPAEAVEPDEAAKADAASGQSKREKEREIKGRITFTASERGLRTRRGPLFPFFQSS